MKDRMHLFMTADLKKRFKVWCKKQGMSMTDALEMAIESLMCEPTVAELRSVIGKSRRTV